MSKAAHERHYLMENPAEPRRLEAKTDPARVRERLRLGGLRAGDVALDVGAGTGAVARMMAKLAGARGRVVAVDMSGERLRFGAELAARCRNLDFAQADADRLPFAPATFDFVWSEFLFEYLARPERTLDEMVRVARPGGRVVVADLDGNGFFHHPLPFAVADAMPRVQAALDGLFDPFVGRKLFGMFRAARLDDIAVQMLPYNLHAGAASAAAMENWTLKLDTIARRVEPALGKAAWRRFRTAFLRHLGDPDTFSYSALFIVSGTKPRAHARR